MGDFNKIRFRHERSSNYGCDSSMEDFNSFIRELTLFEFPLGGRKFTWVSDDDSSLSKLYRFMVYGTFMDKWRMATATILPKRFSDHSPIVLLNDSFAFGPTPFRFFTSWLHLEGLDSVVKKTWENSSSEGTFDKRLAQELKDAKNDIESWKADLKRKENEEYQLLLKKN